MAETGLITLDNPYDFATTEERILKAINTQSDAVTFRNVDLLNDLLALAQRQQVSGELPFRVINRR